MASSNERMQKMLAKDRVFTLMQIMYNPDRFADVIQLLDNYKSGFHDSVYEELDSIGLTLTDQQIKVLVNTFNVNNTDITFQYLQQLMKQSLADYINAKTPPPTPPPPPGTQPPEASGLLEQMKALEAWLSSPQMNSQAGFQQAYSGLQASDEELFDFITKQINIADIKHAHVVANFFLSASLDIPEYLKNAIEVKMRKEGMRWDGESSPGIVDLRKNYTPTGKPNEKAINLIRCTDIGVSQNTAELIINQKEDFINTNNNLMCDGNRNPFRQIKFDVGDVPHTVAAKQINGRLVFYKVPIDKLDDKSAYKLIDAKDSAISTSYEGGMSVLEAIADSFKQLSNYANGFTLTADDLNTAALQASAGGGAGAAPAASSDGDSSDSTGDTDDESLASVDSTAPSAESTSTAGKSGPGGKAETTPGGASATPTPTGDASDLQKFKSQLDTIQRQLDDLMSPRGPSATDDAIGRLADELRNLIGSLPRGGDTNSNNTTDNSFYQVIRNSYNNNGGAGTSGEGMTAEALRVLLGQLRGAAAGGAGGPPDQQQHDNAAFQAMQEQLKDVTDLLRGVIENRDQSLEAMQRANQQAIDQIHGIQANYAGLIGQMQTVNAEQMHEAMARMDAMNARMSDLADQLAAQRDRRPEEAAPHVAEIIGEILKNLPQAGDRVTTTTDNSIHDNVIYIYLNSVYPFRPDQPVPGYPPGENPFTGSPVPPAPTQEEMQRYIDELGRQIEISQARLLEYQVGRIGVAVQTGMGVGTATTTDVVDAEVQTDGPSPAEDEDNTLNDQLSELRAKVAELERQNQDLSEARGIPIKDVEELSNRNSDLSNQLEALELKLAEAQYTAESQQRLASWLGGQLRNAELKIAELEELLAARPVPVSKQVKKVGTETGTDMLDLPDTGSDASDDNEDFPRFFRQDSDHGDDTLKFYDVEGPDGQFRFEGSGEASEPQKEKMKLREVRFQPNSVKDRAPISTGCVSYNTILQDTNGNDVYVAFRNKEGDIKLYKQGETQTESYQEVVGLSLGDSGEKFIKLNKEKKISLKELNQMKKETGYELYGYVFTNRIENIYQDDGQLDQEAIGKAVRNGWKRDHVNILRANNEAFDPSVVSMDDANRYADDKLKEFPKFDIAAKPNIRTEKLKDEISNKINRGPNNKSGGPKPY